MIRSLNLAWCYPVTNLTFWQNYIFDDVSGFSMTSFFPRSQNFPSKKKILLFFIFLFNVWKKMIFLFLKFFWPIFGTGTSSEKGQCCKYGRNFEKNFGIRFHIKFKENFNANWIINKKVIKRKPTHCAPPSRNRIKSVLNEIVNNSNHSLLWQSRTDNL